MRIFAFRCAQKLELFETSVRIKDGMEASLKKSETKFLHDIATPISIIGILTRKLVKEHQGEASSSDQGKQMERLAKILKAVESLEALHANRKSEVTST